MRGFWTSILTALLLGPGALSAQESADDAVRAFLDCQGGPCFDSPYYRETIDFVDWVRDRQVADVHILVTSERTGGRAQLMELAFLGGGRFQNRSDTLHYTALETQTEVETREGFTRVLAAGLVRYAAATSTVERLRIDLEGGPEGLRPRQLTPEDDPWNFWVFSASANGSFSGESSVRSYSGRGSFIGRRITDRWKIVTGAFSNYQESRFEVEDETVRSLTRSYSLEASAVRSLGEHWSAGAKAVTSHDTRLNQDLALRISPAVEYNVYRWPETTRRQFTIEYSLGLAHFDYAEVTLFEKTRETMLDHAFVAVLEQREPWGSANASLGFFQFLRSPERYSVAVNGNVRVRVARGLTLRGGASYEWVRDQIYLPLREATAEEILLRRRQLATDFEFSTFIGIEYTFGSIFNTVVNPRLPFRRSGG